MTEDQIKHMVNRFLGWKLPRDKFNPDCGISFDKKPFNAHTPYPSVYEPSGTNLFDATQADAMVRYMLEGIPLNEHDTVTAAVVLAAAKEALRIPAQQQSKPRRLPFSGALDPAWNPKLERCPHCEAQAYAAPSGSTGAVIRCSECSARTVSEHGVVQAAEDWNSRPAQRTPAAFELPRPWEKMIAWVEDRSVVIGESMETWPLKVASPEVGSPTVSPQSKLNAGSIAGACTMSDKQITQAVADDLLRDLDTLAKNSDTGERWMGEIADRAVKEIKRLRASVTPQERSDLPPVERIEMVKQVEYWTEPAEPMWRVQVGEYVTDFSHETAANNFRNAILAFAGAPSPHDSSLIDMLEALRRWYRAHHHGTNEEENIQSELLAKAYGEWTDALDGRSHFQEAPAPHDSELTITEQLICAEGRIALLTSVIRDTAESIERGSTSAPVLECLKSALALSPLQSQEVRAPTIVRSDLPGFKR